MIFLQAGQNQMGFEESHTNSQKGRKNLKNIFVAESPIMKTIHEKIKNLALSPHPVLILGAYGAGRSTTAYEIFKHGESTPFKEFIKFICYGLKEEDIDIKLFGNENKEGFLACGSSNTLFIKGIECLSVPLQRKLLHYILNSENKEKLPRLIGSAGDEIYQQIKDGGFIQELFEVLNKNILIIPQLSERQEDIPFLISLFNSQNNFTGSMTEEALRVLKSYPWKGNISELKNVCFQISVVNEDKMFITENELDMIPEEYRGNKNIVRYNPEMSLNDLTNMYIQMSLEHFQSKKVSAKALGISVKTIYNKIKTGEIVFSE